MVQVGVILSGCGFLDGSEIHEAVLTLLALDRAGAPRLLAPNVEQASVINHRSGKPRDPCATCCWSARIARGKVQDVAKVSATGLDALVLPGGFASEEPVHLRLEGRRGRGRAGVLKLVRAMHAAKKPIGAWCAPRSSRGGAEEASAADDRRRRRHREGARVDGHAKRDHSVTGVCVGRRTASMTTPAYMYEARIGEVAQGIEKAVAELLRMC